MGLNIRKRVRFMKTRIILLILVSISLAGCISQESSYKTHSEPFMNTETGLSKCQNLSDVNFGVLRLYGGDRVLINPVNTIVCTGPPNKVQYQLVRIPPAPGQPAQTEHVEPNCSGYMNVSSGPQTFYVKTIGLTNDSVTFELSNVIGYNDASVDSRTAINTEQITMKENESIVQKGLRISTGFFEPHSNISQMPANIGIDICLP